MENIQFDSGVKQYRINGGGVLRFHPGDPNLYRRFQEAVDKIAQLGLTLEDGETISVPGIKELPLTLECKVIYKQDQVLESIEEGCRNRYYAQGTPNDGDYHTAYYGLVTAACIIR